MNKEEMVSIEDSSPIISGTLRIIWCSLPQAAEFQMLVCEEYYEVAGHKGLEAAGIVMFTLRQASGCYFPLDELGITGLLIVPSLLYKQQVMKK